MLTDGQQHVHPVPAQHAALAQTLAHREQADLTMDGLAERLDLSRSAIGAYEEGRNLPSQPVLEAICRVCNASDKFDVLNELRKDARKPGWYSTSGLPEWLKKYVGLEDDAVTARVFSIELIPGLLQIEGYARQLHSLHSLSDEDIERRVAARLRRQQRLTGPHPLSLVALISEAALHRLFAEPDMATAQLHHLAASARLPNVSLRILPFAAGLHRSMSGSFTLLDFAPGISSPIAYQEYAVGAHLVDNQKDVSDLVGVYDQLQTQALDEQRTLDMIRERIER
ncbi:MAG: helix-turn-helix domain-containing protein [Pseudonocardiaceae bacterium]